MNVKTKLLITTFVAACAFSGSAQAEQSPLETIVTGLVKSSLAEVTREINTTIQRDILTSSYESLAPSDKKVGKVTIKDLVVESKKIESNQAQPSDD